MMQKETNKTELSAYHMMLCAVGGVLFLATLIPTVIKASFGSVEEKLSKLYFQGAWGIHLFVLCITIALAVQIYSFWKTYTKPYVKVKKRTPLEEFVLSVKWLLVIGFFVWSCIFAFQSASETEVANYGRYTMLFKMGDAAFLFSRVVVFLIVGWLLGKAFLVMSILWFIAALFHGSFELALCYEICMEVFTGMDGWLPQITGLILFSLEALKTFFIEKRL